MTHCTTHIIPEGTITLKDEVLPSKKELDRTLKYLQSKNIHPQFGDLVMFEEYSGYRNDGITIFDGKKIIDLARDPDDYGTLPKKFRVLQKNENGSRFPLFYWHNLTENEDWQGITHNTYVWFDHRPYVDELIKNITYDNKLFMSTSNVNNYALYTHLINDDGTKIYIVLCYIDSLCDISLEGWKKIMQGYKMESVHFDGSRHHIIYTHSNLPKFVDNSEKCMYNKKTYKVKQEIVEDLTKKMIELIKKDKLLSFECTDRTEHLPFNESYNILYLQLYN